MKGTDLLEKVYGKHGLPNSLIGFRNIALFKLKDDGIRRSFGSKKYNTLMNEMKYDC